MNKTTIVEADLVTFYDCDRANKDRDYSGSRQYYSVGKVIRIRTTEPLYLPISDILFTGGQTVADIELSDGRISNGHFITGLKHYTQTYQSK